MDSNFFSRATPDFEGGIASLDSFEPMTAEEDSGSNHCEGNINSNKTPQSIRRPGRPPGSRNKPKPNPVIYKDRDDTIMPHVLQVEAGGDIVDCLRRFYNSLQVGALYVMSATGTVGEVAISMVGSVTYFRGILQILSLSGSYLPSYNSLSVILAGYIDKVIAGTVEGILRAAGPVDIIVGSCVNPSFHIPRLISPFNGEEGDGNSTGHPTPPFSEAIGYSTPSSI